MLLVSVQVQKELSGHAYQAWTRYVQYESAVISDTPEELPCDQTNSSSSAIAIEQSAAQLLMSPICKLFP